MIVRSTIGTVTAPSDEAIVERARAGDRGAFTRIVETRIDALHRTATAILHDEAAASDAVQETFVNAWRELPTLRQLDRFDAWLTRSLVNRCRSQLRSRRRVQLRELSIEAADTPGPGSRAVAFADRVVDLDAIRRAFDRLTADQRAVIVLHHLEQRPIAEIAPILGIAEGTVKWRLHEARRALDRALTGEAR